MTAEQVIKLITDHTECEKVVINEKPHTREQAIELVKSQSKDAIWYWSIHKPILYLMF